MSKQPHFRICLGALALALVSVSSPALANGVTLAVEVGPEVVLTESEDDDLNRIGLGVAARLGYSFSSSLLTLTPEAKFGFESPGTPNSASAMGGVRLNLFETISPALFAHAGGLVGQLSGFVWDAGIGLDLGLNESIDLGVFASYFQVGKAKFTSTSASYQSSSWHWMQVGGQCAVHF